MSTYNPDDFVYFCLLERYINRASNTFTMLYRDSKTGEEISYNDHNGNPKKFKFNRAQRMLRIPARQTELIEKIRNHPACYDSPNGSYRGQGDNKYQTNALFKELNEQKDAQLHLNAAKLRQAAMNLCMEVIKDEIKTEDLALVLGINAKGQLAGSKLVMYAENNPQDFIDQAEAPDFKARALAQKAIAANALQRIGVMYKAGDFEYGLDIDEVVSTLIKDEDKRKFLARQFKED